MGEETALVIDTGDPNADRGFAFSGVPADSETRSIIVPEGAALSDCNNPSCGSPRLALRAARPYANCSCITARTSARILSAS